MPMSTTPEPLVMNVMPEIEQREITPIEKDAGVERSL